MAITFPRAFPALPSGRRGWFQRAAEFQLEYQQTMSLTGGGSPDAADVGPAMWVGEWQTIPLNEADFSTWDAWLATLRGRLRLFKAVPPRRRYPRSRPDGFAGLVVGIDPWTGSGNLQAIGAQRDSVTVNQMPNGLVLAEGDYFSIPGGARQLLHKIVEGGTVSSNAVTLSIEPAIRVGITTGIAVLFDGPYCEMTLDGKPTQPLERDGRVSIRIRGRQTLI